MSSGSTQNKENYAVNDEGETSTSVLSIGFVLPKTARCKAAREGLSIAGNLDGYTRFFAAGSRKRKETDGDP